MSLYRSSSLQKEGLPFFSSVSSITETICQNLSWWDWSGTNTIWWNKHRGYHFHQGGGQLKRTNLMFQLKSRPLKMEGFRSRAQATGLFQSRISITNCYSYRHPNQSTSWRSKVVGAIIWHQSYHRRDLVFHRLWLWVSITWPSVGIFLIESSQLGRSREGRFMY